MDQILGQILRQAVWERLDMLDELATNADGPSLASVARTELPRLTDGWRALLKAHEPDGKGNCPSCSSRWRAQKAPCSVWQAAHQHLVAPEQPAVPPARDARAREAGVARAARTAATGVHHGMPQAVQQPAHAMPAHAAHSPHAVPSRPRQHRPVPAQPQPVRRPALY